MTLVTRDPVTGLRRGPIRFRDGNPPVPSGCRWCGLPESTHGRAYIASAGMHTWERPTVAQVLARMRARAKAQREASRMAPIVAAFERGADLVGPSERRRRDRAEQTTPTSERTP
ncbi:hypothetical protein [Streptomyces carpinensis]|uniref:Uncharacterized protein n=1 Tax=Streptomyces carpinensis TaxID=66369 RepID=A0ABV1VVR0_9ACTN|nr:hypothetical protein [Streptomyces carpinensis]